MIKIHLQHISLTWLILCTACGTPSLKSRRGPASEAPVAISEALRTDLQTIEAVVRPRLATLDRELVTFHYEKESESMFIPTSLEDARTRVAGWTENFYDITTTKGMGYEFGPGEYVAVDPSASRDLYGHATPQLYAFNLARGARVFDGTIPYDAREKAALEEIYNRRQCIGTTTAYPDNISSLLGDMRRSGVDDCMRLIIRAFQDLSVDGIVYEFPASSTLDGCRPGRGAAIIVIRNRAIRFDQFAYYDHRRKFESRPMSKEIAALYAEASRDPSFDLSGAAQLRPPASLPPPPPVSDPTYAAWKAKHVYMCGPPSPIDQRDAKTDLSERFIKLHRDPEVISAFIRLRDSYFSKFPLRPLRLSHLNGLERLIYQTSVEDRIKFSDWTAAKDIGVDAETGEQMRQTAALLGEAYSGDAFSYPKFISAVVSRSRVALRNLGFGPRLSRLKLNSLLLQIGAVPILSGDQFRVTQGDRARSKKLYLDLLARCAARYLETDQSTEQIDRSECGFRDEG